jgi:glycogen(starch) synthase
VAALAEQVEVDVADERARHDRGRYRVRSRHGVVSPPVRIAMLSWEFPPLVVGGIAPHVHGLAGALARAGHDVVVITFHHPDVDDDAAEDGVRAVRVRTDLPWLPEDQFIARMATSNHHLVTALSRLDGWVPDVVHAHDWLVAWAGNTLHTVWRRPLVATIHATERGRQGGHIPPGQPSAINSIEWWLTYQASQVIACSEFMRHEVVSGFNLPGEKVHVVPNGVDPAPWAPPRGVERTIGSDHPLVVTWGRVQYEKGFQTLVQALPEVRYAHPGIRVVIAGRGGYLEELRQLAVQCGVADTVQFPGFVPDEDLRAMLHRAAAAVIPSLYEPFGIVALEALAAGAPLIAARSGGLAEVLDGTGAARLFPPGDAGALAGSLRQLLNDPAGAMKQQATGHGLIAARYTWDAIAAATLPIYAQAYARRRG